MNFRHLKAIGAAAITTLAAGLAAAAPAPALEVDPALLHSDAIASLAHPVYGRTDDFAGLDEAAKAAGEALTARAAEEAQNSEEIDKTERDCAKGTLGALGWDIWWAVTGAHSFDLGGTAEHLIEACLDTYLPGEVDAPTTARDFAAEIARDAETVYQQEEGDIYGVADWLLYADYYYVEQ